MKNRILVIRFSRLSNGGPSIDPAASRVVSFGFGGEWGEKAVLIFVIKATKLIL